MNLLRLHQVIKIVPISRSELWRKVKNGDFPKPIKLSPRVTVWRQDDIESWVKSR